MITVFDGLGPCHICPAGSGQPCRGPDGVLRFPHRERPAVSGRGYKRGTSRYTRAVQQILDRVGVSVAVLAERTGLTQNTIYRHLSDDQRTMSFVTAETLAEAVGYQAQVRFVAVGDEPDTVTPHYHDCCIKDIMHEKEWRTVIAANIQVACPTCDLTFGLRFDPGPEDAAPALAAEQLKRECPDHRGKTWEFWPINPSPAEG